MPMFGGNGGGGLTQTAGTVIQALIPPRRDGITSLNTLVYTDGGTAHTLTIMRPLGRTTIAAAAATSQAVFSLTADPGVAAGYGGISNAAAANDFLAVRTASDGITRLYKISSITGLAVTATSNVVVAMAAGDAVWFFGITSDTDGRTGMAHPKFLGGAGSAATTFQDTVNGLVASLIKDEPLLVNSNNATNAGTISQYTYAYRVY